MNAPARYLALDVFRGLTICLMIIVNTPGNGATTFAPLNHANWHGFTPTDLVFPSFLFAVGNALSFVMNKWERMSTGRKISSTGMGPTGLKRQLHCRNYLKPL